MGCRSFVSVLGLLALTVFFFAQCTKDGGTTNPVSSGILIEQDTYTATADKIIYTAPADTYTSCYGSSLNSYTNPSRTDTMSYLISGNTLSLLPSESDSSYTSGAVYENTQIYARVGSGTGLEGTWNYSSMTTAVISGTLDDQDSSDLEDENNENEDIQLVFGGGLIKVYTTWNWAEEFSHNLIDTSDVNITMTVISSTSIRLRGNVSTEVVTITFNTANQNVTFSSSMATHATHTYYHEPTTCPNEDTPDWFDSFFMANVKIAAKKSSFKPVLPEYFIPKIFNGAQEVRYQTLP